MSNIRNIHDNPLSQAEAELRLAQGEHSALQEQTSVLETEVEAIKSELAQLEELADENRKYWEEGPWHRRLAVAVGERTLWLGRRVKGNFLDLIGR